MLKKIPTTTLKVGMFVADLGRAWFNHPWATKSKIITSPEDIRKLLEYGITEVTIDPAKTKPPPQPQAVAEAPASSAASATPPATPPACPSAGRVVPPAVAYQTELDELLPQAFKDYKKGLDTSKALWAACRMNKRIELEEVKESVGELVESVSKNRDAMAALIKLRRFDDYTYTHCLNVSVLSISMASHLELDAPTLHLLGLGTMFHDLGKARIPGHILNKPGKLTDKEFEVMRSHPTLGANMILEQKLKVAPEVLDIVLHHHEKADGTGYPVAQSSSMISSLATICALSDVYDALTSDRVYHKGMSPPEALKIIYSMRGTHFESEWVDKFVQCVGIYPPGSIVELSSGEVAVVAEVNHNELARPIVKLVADEAGKLRTKSKLLNLAEAGDRQIKRLIPRSEAGFDPAHYFNLEAPK